MKKILSIVFFVCLLAVSLSLSACEDGYKSAYEIYCEANPDYTGTEAEWLESLKGKSAYELYCEANPNYTGTEAEWLESLKGKSAYELYCKANPDYKGTEEQWLLDLANGEFGKEHTVTFNLGYGDTSFTQTVKNGKKIIRPENPERIGYEFKAWVYQDGEESEIWSFGSGVVTGDMTLTATWDYATMELPIININTDGAEINSKEDYTDMVFSIENCEDELSEVSGGIRLRGNSTMHAPKKPYRIKFDKKQSLFGLDKAKSWVLLADYLDPSALHNHTAFSLGNEMDGLSFTPTSNKVNVYLNGDFVGLYTLCEQVQENEGRMDIELDEISDTMTDLRDYNFFICMDESCIGDVGAKKDETYIHIAEYGKYFEIKYPEKDAFTSDPQFDSFVAQLKVYVKELLDAFANKNIDKIRNEVNVNSLADYLIIDQIMGERDHEKKSFNMYFTNTSDNPLENGKLSFGPIWDYDWALYTPWTGQPNSDYEISEEIHYSNVFFKTMAEVPEFYSLVKERYNLYAKSALEDYIDGFDNLHNSLKESLELNAKLWYGSFDTDITDKNVKFLKDYLTARKELLDELWAL